MRNGLALSEEQANGQEMDIIEEAPPSALISVARAEIDLQISTARAYPRSIDRFKKTAQNMACLDEDTAASCFYSMPRGGKAIEGPSARLAEIVATAWGNLRFGGRVVDIGDRFITAQGVCHDLERNISFTIEVSRRITNKQGRRYDDDMIQVTGNAAISIAVRNAVLKVVPKAYWWPIYVAARQVAAGDIKTLAQRRTAAFDYFHRFGVTDDRILAVLGKPSIEDVGQEDLATLSGIKTAINEEETTVDQEFPELKKEQPAAAAPPVGRTSLKTPAAPPAKKEETPPAQAEESPTPTSEGPSDKDQDTEFLIQKYEMAQTLEEVKAIELEVVALGKTKKYGQKWVTSFVTAQAAAVKRIEG